MNPFLGRGYKLLPKRACDLIFRRTLSENL
jgi:hypothetical protein